MGKININKLTEHQGATPWHFESEDFGDVYNEHIDKDLGSRITLNKIRYHNHGGANFYVPHWISDWGIHSHVGVGHGFSGYGYETYDGFLYCQASSAQSEDYYTVHDNPNAEGKFLSYYHIYISQHYTYGVTYELWGINRGILTFDTSAIGAETYIVGATLRFYSRGFFANTADDLALVVQSGQPTYPHLPIVDSDYYYGNYSGDYGSITKAEITPNSYDNYISLDTDCINKTGFTKLCLRTQDDIAGVFNYGAEADSDQGFGISAVEDYYVRPYLIVYYAS